MKAIEMKDHNLGDTISTSFRLVFKNIGFLLKTIFLLVFVSLLFFAVVGGIIYFTGSYVWIEGVFNNLDVDNISSFFMIFFGILLMLIPFYIIVMIFPAIVIKRLSDYYHQDTDPQPMFSMIKEAFPRILPLFFAFFLMFFGYYIGLLLLIVPGIIFILAWSVTIPTIVIEKVGPIEAMKRSWQLTKERRFQILGIFLVFGLLMYAVMMGGMLVGGLLSFLLMMATPVVGSVAYFILSMASMLIVYPMYMALPMVIYYNLRISKEGYGVRKLEEEFHRPMEGPES